MEKKIFNVKEITESNQNKKRLNKDEVNKVDKALSYGEIPLRTYEMMRNSFVGIK